MENRTYSDVEKNVLDDQEFTEGRKNYFLAGPICFDEKQVALVKSDSRSVSRTGPGG